MKVGVLASSGDLPVILTEELRNAGKQAFVISITKDADDKLKSTASEFYQIGVGQVKKIINTLLEAGVREVVIIGKVSKNVLFKPAYFDTKALRILSKLRDKSDSSIFKAVADEFKSAGIEIIDQRLYLGKLLPSKGVITDREPTKNQWRDIEYGMGLARKIAELGIGQSVVVKDQIPLAIEAIEGTDEAIRRGGRLCNGGAVVAKSVMMDHDFRFDVPTIGLNTINVLIESKISALAIESGKAFLLQAEEAIRKANEAKISIVAV